MNEIQAYRQEENAAIGAFLAECMKAILAEGCAETLADLQRNAYKYTDAGICVSFELFDGTLLYAGDDRARDPKLAHQVREIGFSSIVEGSDAEVPLRWLALCEMESPEVAVAEYGRLTDEVNDEACALWEEVNAEREEEDEEIEEED